MAALDLTLSASNCVSVPAAVAPNVVTAEPILAPEQTLRAALICLEETVQVRLGVDAKRWYWSPRGWWLWCLRP